MLMEELTPYMSGNFEQTAGVTIDEYIDGSIDEQLRTLFLSAPLRFLPVVEIGSECKPQRRQDGSGRITLPKEFLRPASLHMEGWHKTVTRFIDESHPLYELQFSRYTRGGVSKPVAVWTTDGSGAQVIDYFSFPASVTSHTIRSLQCVKNPTPRATTYNLHRCTINGLYARKIIFIEFDILAVAKIPIHYKTQFKLFDGVTINFNMTIAPEIKFFRFA